MTKWRNRINIKEHFTDTPNDEDVLKICKALIPQLERIYTFENSRNSGKLDDDFLWNFDNLIQEFKWIQEAINKGEDAIEFNYSDWTDAFNNYFEQLYDMADEVIVLRGWSDTEKFLWVG